MKNKIIPLLMKAYLFLRNIQPIRRYSKNGLLILFATTILTSCTDENGTEMNGSKDLLGISYLHRLPEIDYVENSTNPKVEGWPAVNQEIIWQGMVRNYSQTKINFNYSWQVDNREVSSGQLEVPGNGETLVEYKTNWSFDRKLLELKIDFDNAINDQNVSNNQRSTYTDAISVGFYVEQTFYDYFLMTKDKTLTDFDILSFEDFANVLIDKFNKMCAEGGTLERLRLDKIVLVPDKSLPLNKGALNIGDVNDFERSQAIPNLDDKSVDIQWGFPTSNLDQSNGMGTLWGFYLHEIGHARYLFDNYGFSIYDGTSNSNVDILENNTTIIGVYVPKDPAIVNGKSGVRVYQSRDQDIMFDLRISSLGEFSAAILDYLKGQRPVTGNWNSPPDLNKILNLLPDQNLVTFVDQNSLPVANAKVSIYQSQVPLIMEGIYPAYFDNIPDIEVQTDMNGMVDFGHNPFAVAGIIMESYAGLNNGTIIVRVEKNDQIGYLFMQASEFNVQYIRGNQNVATYQKQVIFK